MIAPPYNTLGSRKYRGLLLIILSIFAAGSLVFINPLFTQVVDTMIGGMVAAYGIYCGLNVANKYALGKINPPPSPLDQLTNSSEDEQGD
ncbi:MAG: hypothetical protein V1850_00530 [Candidatus Bathyarchaeota archaeon]